jgi:flavin-dependent dehydrogenase
VALLDKAEFPRPKICGECLSPETARLLDRLGVLKAVDAAGAQPLSGMRIVAPDGTRLDAAYPTAGPWRGYRDHALALPREVLDAILLERARTLPVAVRLRHRVTAPPRHGGVLLVGDAAGFYDPFTGEGIYAALRGAELASAVAHGALTRGDLSARALSAWERERRRQFRGKERLARLLQAAVGRRRVADWVAHRLAGRPALLAALLGAIGDVVPPGALLRPGTLASLLSR